MIKSRQETRGYFIQVRGDHADGLMAHKAPLERAYETINTELWNLEAGSWKPEIVSLTADS